MGWFFANGENRGLAMDPQDPFSIDVRSEKAREMIAKLWKEVVVVTGAKTIHFGLDEIDLRGWPRAAPPLTDLWKFYLPFLGRLAKSLHVKFMMWGDQALGPGEAIDACFAKTAPDAAARRKAIPKSALIADWHYKNEDDSQGLLKSLRLWQSGAHSVIASAWYRPKNIVGFAHAARSAGCGFLLTTWAGYVSNEQRMISEFGQFAAMPLAAASYAGSGQIDGEEIFKQLYWPQRKLPPRGISFGSGSLISCRFGAVNLLASALTREAAPNQTLIIERAGFATGTRCVAALKVDESRVDGKVLGTITIHGDQGSVRFPIRYGIHVRSSEDGRPKALSERSAGVDLVLIALPNGKWRSVSLEQSSPYAGLRLCVASIY